jgi:hypothetical protein
MGEKSMRNCLKVVVLTIVLAMGLATTTGCRKGTPTTCKGWVKLLKSPVNGKKAIQNLGSLNCAESIADLEEIFPRSQYKEDILLAVKQINAPEASLTLVTTALADPEAAVMGAAVAEDFARPEFRPGLIEILQTNRALEARSNALRAIAKIDAANLKQDEDLFIKLLLEDPNLQKIEVNAEAARLLGVMKSEKAINALVSAMFLRDQRGRQIYAPVRKAFAAIGKPAVEPLIGVLTKDTAKFGPLLQELEAMTKKMGIFDWQIFDGPELVQVLGDLRDERAAMPIAKDISAILNPPVGVDDRVIRTWQIAQQNRITMSMMALWNVGNKEIIPTLVATIINPDNDAKQRLDTASGLSLVPDFMGIPELITIYKTTKLATFRAPLVKVITLGIDWANYDNFKKQLAAEKSELVKERFAGDSAEALAHQAMVKVLTECKANDVDCLITMLKDANVITGQKAALLMGNVKDPDGRAKALTALLEYYPQIDPRKDVDFRRFVLLAIWRLGDKANLADAQRLLAADKANKGASYWVDELQTFIPAFAEK